MASEDRLQLTRGLRDDPRFTAEVDRYCAEFDALSKVYYKATNEVYDKYVRRVSAIERGEVPPAEPAIILTRPAIIDPGTTVGSVPFGFGKL